MNKQEIVKTAEMPTTPMDMVQQAVASGAGVEVMEKLLALQERYERNQARKAFDNAIADMRGELPKIIKSNEVSFGSGKTAYKYEDLNSIVEAVAPVMARHGLSFRWRTASNGEVTVACIISHRDGHSEETTLSAKADSSGGKNAIQAIGSAVTYLQRYTLKAALGIAAAQDDDGRGGPVDLIKPDVDGVARPQSESPAPIETLSKAKARPVYDRLEKAIRACADEGALAKLWNHEKTAEAFDSMPDDFQAHLLEEYRTKVEQFSGGLA